MEVDSNHFERQSHKSEDQLLGGTIITISSSILIPGVLSVSKPSQPSSEDLKFGYPYIVGPVAVRDVITLVRWAGSESVILGTYIQVCGRPVQYVGLIVVGTAGESASEGNETCKAK
jgi:hypothetical protein